MMMFAELLGKKARRPALCSHSSWHGSWYTHHLPTHWHDDARHAARVTLQSSHAYRGASVASPPRRTPHTKTFGSSLPGWAEGGDADHPEGQRARD